MLDLCLRTTRRRSTLVVPLVLALVAVTGCGGSKGTSGAVPTAPTGAVPTAPTTSPYTGSWVGDMARDTLMRKYVTFSVTSGGDLSARVNVVLLGTAVSGGIATLFTCDNFMTSSPVRIADNSFTAVITSEYGSTRMIGQFTAPEAATGTVESFTPVGSCRPSGVLVTHSTESWTARKQ